MNVELAKAIATRVLGRSSLVLQKHSPEILVITGIVGVVSAAVMASRATLKLEPIVDTFKEGVETAHFGKEHNNCDEDYSSSKYTRDLAYVYGNAGLDLARLYGPAITVGAAGIACILGAHGILRQRNAALATAYTLLEKGYSEYRKRVVDEFGSEKDKEFRYGIHNETITEKGKKVVVSSITAETGLPSPYARFFDEYSTEWSRQPEYNLVFLRSQQRYANDLLKSRGHVFLNEVYDALGLERTSEAALVGWVYNGEGDDFIDFGIYDVESDSARRFVNGLDKSVLLDFNVDGLIFDKI